MKLYCFNDDGNLNEVFDTLGGMDINDSGRRKVLFVGSAISAFEPCKMPNGITVTREISRFILDKVVATSYCYPPEQCEDDERKALSQALEKTAFEHIWEFHPQEEAVRKFLADTYSGNEYNAVHRSIASLFASGGVSHIVTTNYDRCIEEALAREWPSFKYKSITCQHDIGHGIDYTCPVLFKIHGTAEEPKTLFFRMRHEARMATWSQDVLRMVVEGHDLWIVGYSGLDFEICPELVNLNNNWKRGNPQRWDDLHPRLVWFAYQDASRNQPDISDNAKRVISLASGFVIGGDFLKLFCCSGARNKTSILDAGPITESLSEQQKLAWAARLFVAISCGRPAEQVLRRLEKIRTDAVMSEAEWCFLMGFAHYHLSHYLTAAAYYYRAAESANKVGDHLLAIRAMIEQANTLSCGGKFEDALRVSAINLKKHSSLERITSIGGPEHIRTQVTRRMEEIKDKEQKDTEENQYFLLALYWFERAALYTRVHASQDVIKINQTLLHTERKHLATVLPFCKAIFEALGHWRYVQYTVLWAERIGCLDLQHYSQFFEPSKSVVGPLPNVGDAVADLMAHRSRYVTMIKTQRHDFSTKDLLKINDRAKQALALGSHAEAWKWVGLICRALHQGLVQEDDIPHESRRILSAAFNACEYEQGFRQHLIQEFCLDALKISQVVDTICSSLQKE